jgi:Uma2 family endonuclease
MRKWQQGETMATKTAMTWEEFVTAGEEWQRWEYVDGEVEFMSPANSLHGVVIFRLTLTLGRYCESNPDWIGIGADSAFTMSSGDWRCPDAALVRAERFPDRKVPATPASFPPDIAFEVISPSDTAMQIQRKQKDYQENGVIQVWINPVERMAEVIYPDKPAQYFDEDQPVVIDILPGFALNLKDLFSV